MANKKILAIVLMITLAFATIISIPIVILSAGFSPNIIIEDSLDPKIYAPENSSGLHQLNLDVDVGNIEITYTYQPVDYHAKIEINYRMIGHKIPGILFTDYFEVVWIKTNTTATLNVELLSESWFDPSRWISQELSIIVTLNPNYLFDINTTINKEGTVDLIVPGGVSINNVVVNIIKGTALLDFTHCTIEGNFTGFTNNGDITLKTNNVFFTQNSLWNFTNNIGEILLDIFQSKEMGSNITGVAETKLGVIKLIYIDKLPEVAARVALIN